jgi:hypothetical protein
MDSNQLCTFQEMPNLTYLFITWENNRWISNNIKFNLTHLGYLLGLVYLPRFSLKVFWLSFN